MVFAAILKSFLRSRHFNGEYLNIIQKEKRKQTKMAQQNIADEAPANASAFNPRFLI